MHVHAPSLHRLMRTLASMGILTERTEERFALIDLGKALKTGAPGSARSSLLVFGSAWALKGLDNMIYSVQTGKTGFEKAHGVSIFEYLAQHPDDASLFSETMVGFHSQEPPAVAAAYDFSTFNKQQKCSSGRSILSEKSAARSFIARKVWPNANDIEAAGSVRNKSCECSLPHRNGNETGMVKKCPCPARQAMNHAVMAIMLFSVVIRGPRPVI
jgi:hypothetical protein